MNPQKHLLPKDFYVNGDRSNKYNDTVKLPMPSLDIIFNHKNIWANLQNHNPNHIKFHLHKIEDWMPLIHDTNQDIEHPRVKEKKLRETLQKNNKEYVPEVDLEEEFYMRQRSGSKKSGMKQIEEL